MITPLRYALEPMDDHCRLKSCIVYLLTTESGYIELRKRYPGEADTSYHKFLSLIGMHDESIKYRIRKHVRIH